VWIAEEIRRGEIKFGAYAFNSGSREPTHWGFFIHWLDEFDAEYLRMDFLYWVQEENYFEANIVGNVHDNPPENAP
jgi:hypothetical protein